MAKFKSISSQVDFPSLERELLEYWYKKEKIIDKYLTKNNSANKKFSFLDGPITANNPMGVHHAWGRTYKDLWQRFFNMRGFAQRFQNGFDEQGLWVEVEVEKELNLKNKKEIENLIPGDKFKSLEKFINLCKDRVKKYSGIQTEQSKRLGYFMDWDHSYHTSSDENNYAIWNYLKVVNEKGWLYKGRDSVPWCPRCGTAISQHEILTEEYQELTHLSLFFQLPIKDKKMTYLLVWTTTPWTIPANVAVAVDTNLEYAEVIVEGKNYIIALALVTKLFPDKEIKTTYRGADLVGWQYEGPFEDLPVVRKAFDNYHQQVIATDPLILPISIEEGTGLVHIAPGAGAEDFALGKKENLPVISPIDETGVYVEGFDWLSGLSTTETSSKIADKLKEAGFLFKSEKYLHRYPLCWRCKTELIWRTVDEWYIGVERKDESGKTYREQMMEVAQKINWLPIWGLERELDWLKNMHDWLISKKRYWGLALPIWECQKCGHFEVIGSKKELQDKAVEGWEEFKNHSPHRPWIDQIKIKCSKCDEKVSRVPDVGNPWLDAGIVPFSTLPSDWFPADFITESFPGQFKNWFYSLIAMSTALIKTNPFKTVLGHGLVRDEKGEEMHKSKGNAIEFNKAADKIGVDVMRWIYLIQNPEHNLNFGFVVADEVRRRFYLIFWNCYKFFIDYANLADWSCVQVPADTREKLTLLDRWILAGLTKTVLLVNDRLAQYDAMTGARAIEKFITEDLSTWYIRRSRDRVGPGTDKEDERVFLSTLYGVLVVLSKLLAPFLPFISEEIYRNLTGEKSVHLSDYPLGDNSLLNDELMKHMEQVRKLVEIGHAQRKEANIKLRQPLGLFIYSLEDKLNPDLEQILAQELNVKQIEYKKSSSNELSGKLDTNITHQLKTEGQARELIRQIQNLRKEAGLTLKDKVKIITPVKLPQEYFEVVLRQTNAKEITFGEKTSLEIVQ